MAVDQEDSCWACFGIPAGIPLPQCNTTLYFTACHVMITMGVSILGA